MRLRFGNFYHRIAEVDLQISRRAIENAMKVVVMVEELWICQGRIHNLTGNAATMTALLRAFEQAYAVNGKDLVLEYANGRSAYHQLLNRDCIGGTMVVEPPSFPSGKKGEAHTFRTYRLVVKGIRPTFRSPYMSFKERIRIKGGGARWGCLEVNEGEGVRQRLRTHTTCFATQSGSAVGLFAAPDIPPPIWPYALTDELPEIDEEGPDTVGEGTNAMQTNFGRSWTYSYEATQRLWGTPHYLRG